MIKYLANLFSDGREFKLKPEVTEVKGASKSPEHLLWEAENSTESNQRKQDIEDASLERHCQNEADRLFCEQLNYSKRNEEMNKYFFKEDYNPKKIYGGLVIPNIPSFIMMHSGAKSVWSDKSCNDRINEILNDKIKKYENCES